jgi:hypothetical protein
VKTAWIKEIQSRWRDKWKQHWEVIEWPLLFVLASLTILCGILGFRAYFSAHGEFRSLLDCLYLTLQLFTLESGSLAGAKTWPLELARFAAPLLSGYAALQALQVLFSRQITFMRLAVIKDHTIICGLGRKGYMLALDFWTKGYNVAVIEQNEHNPFIPMTRATGIPVLTGNAADAVILRQARLLHAEKLICVCGEDGVNAEIAMMAQALWQKETHRTLHCFVHIVEPAVWDLLHGRKFAFDSQSLHMEFFNIYDWGAKRILEKFPAFTAATPPQTPPHILIVGLGKFGASLLLLIARTWFWQTRRRSGAAKLTITVIDKVAKVKVQQLIRRYPRLQTACHLIPVQTDIRWFDADANGKKTLQEESNPVQQVYICLDSDAMALHSAGMLQDQLRDRQTPIIIRMAVQSGLAALLTAGQEQPSDALRVFHLLNETCRVEALQDYIDILAQTIHAGYIEHCKKHGRYSADKPSQKSWQELSPDLQNSNRDQAHHLPIKLEKIGYKLKPLCDWDADRKTFSRKKVDAMAEMEHERWLAERGMAHWRLGQDDAANKTNPNMRSWQDLDEATKDFDRHAICMIPRLLAKIDLQMYSYRRKP